MRGLDAPTGGESREAARRGENYIPWEQIEPLLTEGMAFTELRDVLLTRLGLPVKEYTVLAKWCASSVIDCLRADGLVVVKRDSQRAKRAGQREESLR